MATPVAHSLAGWSLCLVLARPRRIDWRDALLAAALTVVPDFDLAALFVLGAPEGHYWHHTVTHSAGFALLAGVVAAAVSRLHRGRTAWGESALVALLIASHAVVDYFTADWSEPRGVPMAWPLSVEFFIAPEPVFLNINRQGLWDLLSGHNARAVVREALVLLPVLGSSLLLWRWWRPEAEVESEAGSVALPGRRERSPAVRSVG